MKVSVVRFTKGDNPLLGKNNFYHLYEVKGQYKFRTIKNGIVEEYDEQDLKISSSELDLYFERIPSDGLCAFEGNEFYWERFLEILNSMPEAVVKNLNKDIIRNVSQVTIQLLPKDKLSRVILNTPLRELYSLLGDDIPRTLSKLFLDSVKKFTIFNNKEENFCGLNKRKPLSMSAGKDTQMLQAFFQELTKESGFVELDQGRIKYQYLDYEVSPIRATRALSETGISGRSSGAGGLDLVCFNHFTGLPVLIEYKSRSDHSLFYALVQLLTYASELSTENQFERLKRCYGLKCQEKRLELAIIFDEDKKKEQELESLIDQCTDFMGVKEIRKYIRSLVFIKKRTSKGEKICLELVERIPNS